MKTKFLLAGLIALISLTGCFKMENKINNYINQKINQKKNGTIVFKVNDTAVSLKEIRDEMKNSLQYDNTEEQLKRMMGDENLIKAYEDKILNQYLIMKSMIDNNETKDQDFENFIWFSIKEAIVKYYLYKNFFSNQNNERWKEVMVTTDSEVLGFYNENKKFFDDKEVKKDDALFAIRNDIQQRKAQVFMIELTKYQNNLINQLKSEYKIKRVNN